MQTPWSFCVSQLLWWLPGVVGVLFVVMVVFQTGGEGGPVQLRSPPGVRRCSSSNFASVLSHLLLVLVRLLHDGQLGVRICDRQIRVRSVASSVQHQRPLLEEAAVHAIAVESDLSEQYPYTG